MHRLRKHSLAIFCAAGLALIVVASKAAAAGGAFAVDDSEVDAPDECKVEAWTAFARNRDFIGVRAPACVVDLGRPVELGAQIEHTRSGGEWGTGLAVKAKTALVPLNDRIFGVALIGGIAFDLTVGETSELFLAVPVTVVLAEPFKLNLNIGGLWDRIEDRGFVIWGAGFELSLADPFTLIGEVFGAGSEPPGLQLGLRYTPHKRIDFDLIYGRNLAGERSDWITAGVNLRF